MFRAVNEQVAVFTLFFLLTAQTVAWGHEGHRVVALFAEHYMTPGRTDQGR
jgi:hypothetical protein